MGVSTARLTAMKDVLKEVGVNIVETKTNKNLPEGAVPGIVDAMKETKAMQKQPYTLQEVTGRTETKVALIDPDTASDILTNCRYEGQRTLRNHRVELYARMMRQGEWTEGLDEITLGVLDGTQYLIDGQHRLWAIIESGISIVFEVKLLHFNAKRELDEAYYNTDRGMNRSDTDMIKASGLVTDLGLPGTVLNHANAALRFIANNFMHNMSRSDTATTTHSREVMLREWAGVIALYHDTVGYSGGLYSNTRRLYNRPTLAVGLVTMKYNPERASGFWNRIANNSDLRAGTPEHTLAQYLNREDRKKHSVDSEGIATFARKVAYAWNAFYNNKASVHLIVKDPTRPIIIAGSPYTESKAQRREKVETV